jgi:hypothetical protein
LPAIVLSVMLIVAVLLLKITTTTARRTGRNVVQQACFDQGQDAIATEADASTSGGSQPGGIAILDGDADQFQIGVSTCYDPL